MDWNSSVLERKYAVEGAKKMVFLRYVQGPQLHD
jgi:hypothetical protein